MDSSIYTGEGLIGLLMAASLLVLLCLKVIGAAVEHRHEVCLLRVRVERLRKDLLARHAALRRANRGDDDEAYDVDIVEGEEAEILEGITDDGPVGTIGTGSHAQAA